MQNKLHLYIICGTCVSFEINLFFETLPKANINDKTKPIGKEITNKSKVLSSPPITSTKILVFSKFFALFIFTLVPNLGFVNWDKFNLFNSNFFH